MEKLVGTKDQKVAIPSRGERVAAFVEQHMNQHRGLTLGEIAFRVGADKRDMQRLLRERSCGWRLEDDLVVYFGAPFVRAVFAELCEGPSLRERELQAELSDLARENERSRPFVARIAFGRPVAPFRGWLAAA